MNRSLIFILSALLMVVACNPTSPKDKLEPDNNHNLSNNLDEYFSALTSLKKFNGALLIQKDDGIILYKAYNIEKDDENSLFVDKNDQFDIHSISKLMAKACVEILEEDGLIKKNDPLSDFIPDFPNGDKISIQHLLDNQSGLPRSLSKKPDNLIDKNPSEFIDLIKREELLYTPGSETLYSNLGYQLIYFIISKITGKPFVENLKDKIFNPLEMNDSGAHFYIDKSNLKRPVKNHVKENGEMEVVPNYGRSSKNQSRVYSTLEDLLKFIIEVKKEPYYSSLKNKNGNIGWSGGGDGILSHAEANMVSDYEIIFFSNYDEIPFGKILEDVEKIMTNKPYNLPREINRTSIKVDRDIIEKYVGKYDMAEFNHAEFEIRIESDSVVFYQDGERGGVLKAENDTTFFGDTRDEDYFIFRKGENGDYNLIFKYKGVDILGHMK